MIYFILPYAEMPVEDRCKKALCWVMNVIMFAESVSEIAHMQEPCVLRCECCGKLIVAAVQ